MPNQRPAIWRNADFVKLWIAQTISMIGSKISFLALPILAIDLLGASPVQMGYLAVAGSLPALLFGLFVGVWVDRQHRRPLLILADLGRSILLMLIPAAAWFGFLDLQLLYAVIFCNGVLGLLFGIAYHSYLPSLVPRQELIAANSRLEISTSAAEIMGPGLAGWLVQAFSAPLAILLDALSFLLSGIFLGFIRRSEPIRHSEPKDQIAEEQQNVWREIGAGLRLVGGNPILRAITGCTGTTSFFNAMLETVAMFYMIRALALTPGQIGLIFGAGSLGFLLGALATERVTQVVSLGGAMIGGLTLLALSDIVLPLIGGPQLLIVIVLMATQFCFGLGLTLYNIGQVSLRQAIAPDHLQGRMNATIGFVVAGIVPLGALAGGLLGEWLGIRPTLLLAASGELLAVVWLLSSPLGSLRRQQLQM